jgi:polyphosphate kinase
VIYVQGLRNRQVMRIDNLKKVMINRELSWLNFNERVLRSAEQENMPLMERIRFLGIFHANLDEFYSVRVGSLHRLLKLSDPNIIIHKTEVRAAIASIFTQVTILNQRSQTLFTRLLKRLRDSGFPLSDGTGLTRRQTAWIEHYFQEKVRDRIFPVMLNGGANFPFLLNLSTYLAVVLERKSKPGEVQYALLEIPETLPRITLLPPENGLQRFIFIDDIIRMKLKAIFHTQGFDRITAFSLSVTRDAEYSLDEQVTKSLYEKITLSIRQRSFGEPVRVVYDSAMPEELLRSISSSAQLNECSSIFPSGRYLTMASLVKFPKIPDSELYFTRQPPLSHHTLDSRTALIPQILKRDHLLSLPYQRFSHMIDLLREASLDPQVVSIKMTLYRVAENSSIVSALINAARNGKRVVVFIEVQARFNEEANLFWTEQLSKEHNVTLISSLEGLKVHSKLCVIRLKNAEEGSSVRIAAVSTGNFNENTARLYSDLILFTAHKGIANEVNKVFKLLAVSFRSYKFNYLLVAPFSLRNRVIALIKREISHAKQDREARIILKINNLVDEQMIRWLCRASQAGVSVILLIRGICCLRPGIPDMSTGITVRAVIDRYLEHARIFCFHNNSQKEYFIGSSDLMQRNLDRRIETLVPVLEPALVRELESYLEVHLHDTYSTFSVDTDMESLLLRSGEPGEVHAQHDLYRFYKEKASASPAAESSP